jgi:CRP-like cAMP-binding protein/thioredoxin reductase/Pyruvate/2-oxoacid:ferredoxin oxidoreductase delta subunit
VADFTVAVVGSGPAGLSAACHAAELGVSHVLLESAPHYANTIFLYQKGKHVMAEPMALPLRAPLAFEPGTREAVLDTWQKRADALGINTRFQTEVTAIAGERGNFSLSLGNGETLTAENVVFGIGLQGNLRKLGCPGEDLPVVQYQLDDPEEFSDEVIVVVGAGDAAIENALALAAQNKVFIVNRKAEFSRAKDANNQAILAAIDSSAIPVECFYESVVERVLAMPESSEKPARVVLKTAEGKAEIACDRIVARLGAIPPRRFVESCGIRFPSDDPAAVPDVSATYESNVPGLYVIGALAGYPLIKQALNQGHEVVEFILGNQVEPADTPLLREKFEAIPGNRSVEEVLALIQERVPMLAALTSLQLREFLLDSDIHDPAPGDTVFAYKDYTDSIYVILDGSVDVHVGAGETPPIKLGRGQFFGEMSLISGRRRSATVSAGADCLLLETPRRSMLRLMASVAAVRRVIDEVFLLRAIQANIAPGCDASVLADVVSSARVERFQPGETLFNEGDAGDCLHLIRSGSVTISRHVGGRDVVLAYVPAGKYVGEMALVSDAPRSATVKAAVFTETIRLEGAAFKALLEARPDVRERVRGVYRERLTQTAALGDQPEAGNLISFLMQQGLGEATDVLLIDESLCIRCDYCERACAATHGNVSRLDREAGPTFANVHVPTSCRHCEHPHCMKDCPPDAIHRNANGEVFIDDTCIGCGNCERNCPYGVIHMGIESDRTPSLALWLLTGLGVEPGTELSGSADQGKRAAKCDMCKDLDGGPACVRACPTGAAVRVSPEQFLRVVER